MLRPSPKGVGFVDLLNVSVTAGSKASLGIDGLARKRFGSTTHPRKWLRVNETGKLNYITVRQARSSVISVELLCHLVICHLWLQTYILLVL